jgi:hypothetical protein
MPQIYFVTKLVLGKVEDKGIGGFPLSLYFQIFKNMLIQCKVPISKFKLIQKWKYEARAESTAF